MDVEKPLEQKISVGGGDDSDAAHADMTKGNNIIDNAGNSKKLNLEVLRDESSMQEDGLRQSKLNHLQLVRWRISVRTMKCLLGKRKPLKTKAIHWWLVTKFAVQELLGITGNVTSFWMDTIMTHCYVSYASVEEAAATREAMYNLQWPPNGGRLLTAELEAPQPQLSLQLLCHHHRLWPKHLQ
ncbi:Uncharacterized protein Rs2_19454 [Raphanus sativus]|nr:Uncharacterized protein Rs2_19454 [Raphanus sativus]